uniref:Uncharacterized protein n=1 Tax=Equus asinus TaxID=9793 RepID=A0A8C4LKV9_EQUAS
MHWPSSSTSTRSCPFSTMRLVVTLRPLTISVEDITDLKRELPAPGPPQEAAEEAARPEAPRPGPSKAEKASRKAGNSPKPAASTPRSPAPRPVRSPGGPSHRSKEKGSRPPKNSRKMSSGLRKG